MPEETIHVEGPEMRYGTTGRVIARRGSYLVVTAHNRTLDLLSIEGCRFYNPFADCVIWVEVFVGVAPAPIPLDSDPLPEGVSLAWGVYERLPDYERCVLSLPVAPRQWGEVGFLPEDFNGPAGAMYAVRLDDRPDLTLAPGELFRRPKTFAGTLKAIVERAQSNAIEAFREMRQGQQIQFTEEQKAAIRAEIAAGRHVAARLPEGNPLRDAAEEGVRQREALLRPPLDPSKPIPPGTPLILAAAAGRFEEGAAAIRAAAGVAEVPAGAKVIETDPPANPAPYFTTRPPGEDWLRTPAPKSANPGPPPPSQAANVPGTTPGPDASSPWPRVPAEDGVEVAAYLLYRMIEVAPEPTPNTTPSPETLEGKGADVGTA